MNHPDLPDDPLLTSAIRHLNEQDPIYVVRDWRTIMNAESLIKAGRRATDPLIPLISPNGDTMTAANAKEKSKAMKDAAKKITPVPKHKPGESAPGIRGMFPQSGVDKAGSGMVHSGSQSSTTTEKPMTEKSQAKAEPTKQEAAEAAQKAKMEAKAAKIKAAADKKEAAEKAKAAGAAEREAKAKLTKEEREAKAAERAAALKAADPEGKRTYFGSMLTLADRVKSGAYTKGMNGQLRSNDDVAVALECVKPENVVKLVMETLGETVNKYADLNVGQQSMNWRNRLRGALRADDGAGLIIVAGTEKEPAVRATITRLKDLRDKHGYATEEDTVAKKAEAKAVKEKAAAEAKALKEVNAKKIADERAAKKAVADKAKAEAKTPAKTPASTQPAA